MTPVTQNSRAMTDSELDAVYTNLCKTMTQLGESQSPMFLARFALLAIDRIADAEAAQQLIAAAAQDLGRCALTLETLRYQSGFANAFATEALAGALPDGRNASQRL